MSHREADRAKCWRSEPAPAVADAVLEGSRNPPEDAGTRRLGPRGAVEIAVSRSTIAQS